MFRIRPLREEEIALASGLSKLVYRSSVEPRWADPGLWNMTERYVEQQSLMEKYKSGQLLLWGIYDVKEADQAPVSTEADRQPLSSADASDGGSANGQGKPTLCGVGGMQREGHITMLYVLPEYQRKGAGGLLMGVMEDYAFRALRLQRITLSAMPSWNIPYFKRFGFEMTNQSDRVDPMFTYMEKRIPKTSGQTARYESRPLSEKTVLIVVLGTLGLLAVIAFAYAFGLF